MGDASHQDATTGNTQTVGQHCCDVTRLALQGDDRRLKHHLNALFAHALQHGIRQLGIKSPQKAWPPNDLKHGHTKPPQDAGELAGDEASSNHNHLMGQVRQLKHVIAHPAEFSSRQLRSNRPATNSDEKSGR